MLYAYHGENHDWDMILGSARTMLEVGIKSSDDTSVEFAAYTSSMLLSLTAVESFTNSLAFVLPDRRPDLRFNLRKFQSSRGFWPRVNDVCRVAGLDSKGGSEPFDVLAEAHEWRNVMVHTQPYSVKSPAIENTTDAVHALHALGKPKEFPGRVSRRNAERYFAASKSYVDTLMATTGVEPRAMASYTANGETLRIMRKTPY